MSLKTRILEDVKNAMRAREKGRLSVLRLVTAAIKQKEVDERIDMNDEQVLAHLQSRIARYKIPKQVVTVDELPRNATGKVLKRELRQRV